MVCSCAWVSSGGVGVPLLVAGVSAGMTISMSFVIYRPVICFGPDNDRSQPVWLNFLPPGDTSTGARIANTVAIVKLAYLPGEARQRTPKSCHSKSQKQNTGSWTFLSDHFSFHVTSGQERPSCEATIGVSGSPTSYTRWVLSRDVLPDVYPPAISF